MLLVTVLLLCKMAAALADEETPVITRTVLTARR